jgi:hypothetical protein
VQIPICKELYSFNNNSHPIKGCIALKEGTYQFVYVNRNTAEAQQNSFKFQNNITYSLGCAELDLPTISDNLVKKIEYTIYRTPTLLIEESIRKEAGRTNASSHRYRKYFYSSRLKIQVEEEFGNGINIVAVYGVGRAPRFNNVGKYIGTKTEGVKERSTFIYETLEFKFLYDPSQRRNSNLQLTFNINDPIYYYIEDYNGIWTSYQGILFEGEGMNWGDEWKEHNLKNKGNGVNNLLFLK